MADRVSPGRTVHVAADSAGPAVASAVIAVTDSLARITRVLLALLLPVLLAVLVLVAVLVLLAALVLAAVLMLVAVLMFAWATGRPGPEEPATATRCRMHQASTTHADRVHLRTMVLLPSWGQRRALLAGRRGQWA